VVGSQLRSYSYLQNSKCERSLFLCKTTYERGTSVSCHGLESAISLFYGKSYANMKEQPNCFCKRNEPVNLCEIKSCMSPSVIVPIYFYFMKKSACRKKTQEDMTFRNFPPPVWTRHDEIFIKIPSPSTFITKFVQ
jgi:hypothetical protein